MPTVYIKLNSLTITSNNMLNLTPHFHLKPTPLFAGPPQRHAGRIHTCGIP